MSYSSLISAAFVLLMFTQAQAFGTRAKSIDFNDNSGADLSATSSSGASEGDMVRLARSASEGAGRLGYPGPYCYRAVKQIIADAFGKDLSCVRATLTGGSGKDAGGDLLRAGFIEDSSKCKTPGAIRVYKGNSAKGFRRLAGDIHGHVEVVGDEGMYHSFYSSSLPINESMAPGRRILTGCYVPDSSKFNSGPLAKCPDSKVSYKTRPSSSGKKKMGVE